MKRIVYGGTLPWPIIHPIRMRCGPRPSVYIGFVSSAKTENSSESENSKLFILEIEYGGIFEVTGVPEDQIHPYLMIECPRILFPYLRRIVGDVTRDGGFPPLNLEQINFLALYQNEIARRQAEAEKATKN